MMISKLCKISYLAHDLIIVCGVESKDLVYLASFGHTEPSNRNTANHLYLSSPKGNSISTTGNSQPLRP